MIQRRRPRGYEGHDHETIGSDIVSVVKSLKLPQITLGGDLTAKLQALDPNGWYPIGWLLDAMDQIEKRLGEANLRQMGKVLFQLSHAPRGIPPSARAVIYGIDAMYRRANRGTGIGGWQVLTFEQGRARVEKNTPHHCAMEEGILIGALAAAGAPASIVQAQCFRKGAETCVLEIRSPVVDSRWG